MKISTITRYGLRAMVDLAMHYNKKYISLSDIAKRQKISVKYLENIMSKLIAGNLVVSSRGRYGGFTLSRPPQQIKVAEVIKALEGDMVPVLCVTKPDICDMVSVCSTHDLWVQMYDGIWKMFNSKSLEDIADEGRHKLESIKSRRKK